MNSKAGLRAADFPLTNIQNLIALYYEQDFDPQDPSYAVSFGTSGHRGSSLARTYTRTHIAAITQAICDVRRELKITGPIYVGKDTHALSEPALMTALEVLTANGVETVIDGHLAYTPTPVISYHVVQHNLKEHERLADGIIITPSHNPPTDGGFKYNPPYGGPAVPFYTERIQKRANEILKGGNAAVKSQSLNQALHSVFLHREDLRLPYVEALGQVIDLKAIRDSGLKIAVNPQGGASLPYWDLINERYGIGADVINRVIDPTFAFMPLDYDEKIRMDCMSPYTMQPLIALKDRYQILIANDPDADRHGIVTPEGLLNSNHYLSAILHYLLHSRSNWTRGLKVGKTVGATLMMDEIIRDAGFEVYETPIGFKWFAEGLFKRELVFGCEESAGASYLDLHGQPFTTDKDGFLAGLIGCELIAKSGLDLVSYYQKLTSSFGDPAYGRIDEPTTAEGKAAFVNLKPQSVKSRTLAGQQILEIQTHAAGNQAPIGGLKVLADECWFTARPSGTENIYKIYYESFLGASHLEKVRKEAVDIVNAALYKAN